MISGYHYKTLYALNVLNAREAVGDNCTISLQIMLPKKSEVGDFF